MARTVKERLNTTLEHVVDGAYLGLLGRPADPKGREAWIAWLRRNGNLSQFLAEFTRSTEFEKKIIERAKLSGRLTLFNENSQYGEVSILLSRIVNVACCHRVIVDVGARGIERSNSYDILKHLGWRGVLVEAHPQLTEELEQKFAGMDVRIIHSAVSDFDGEAKLYLGENLDISSLNREATEGWGQLRGEVRVPVRRLPSILRENEIPFDFDILSIDIEGEDIKVVNDTWNSGYCPKWIIIEASHNMTVSSLDQLEVSDTFRAQYRIIGRTQANLILERS